MTSGAGVDVGEGSGVKVGVRVGVKVKVGVGLEVGARTAMIVPGVHCTKIPVATRHAKMRTPPRMAKVILLLSLPG